MLRGSVDTYLYIYIYTYIHIYIAWCCWKSCINHIFTLYLYYICMLLHVYHIYQSQLVGVHGTTLRFPRLSQVRGCGFHLLPRSRSQCDDSRAMPGYRDAEMAMHLSIMHLSIFCARVHRKSGTNFTAALYNSIITAFELHSCDKFQPLDSQPW